MANSAERLFDSILPNLTSGKNLDWSDNEVDASDITEIDEPYDSDDDRIFSIEEEKIVNAVKDNLVGGSYRQPPDDYERELIEGAVRTRGFETLAFYKSRRIISSRPFPGRWGIFYLKTGLDYIEYEIGKTYPSFSNPRKLALEFLRQHERFHYFADIQTLLFEATLGRHLYLPLHRALKNIKTHFVEEALANRKVWDWAKKSSIGIEEFAYDFMMLQPNAYARFNEPRLLLAAEWAGTVVDQMPPRVNRRADLAYWVESVPLLFQKASLCPEYVIYPAKLTSWVTPALVVPPVFDVEDGKAVTKALQGRFRHLESRWSQTKAKLLENRLLHGLNFKPWRKDGPDSYSVKIDDGFRAHLMHKESGRWIAYILGSHKELGHG